MFSEDDKEQQPYHHGNVKEALIGEAMKFLQSNEVESLSLRRLAREVGVSPSAVYNHFPDKNALMLAIKIRLYGKFNDYIASHCKASEDPVDSLLQICLAYYDFSQEHPARFKMLFSSTLPMEWSTPEMVEVSCHNLVIVRKLVLAIFNKYQVPCDEETVVNTTLLLWSQIHGIISLKNAGGIKAAVRYQQWPKSCALMSKEDVERLISRHVNMTVQAILNDQYNNSHH